MKQISAWRKKPFWIRLLHWEYWSFQVVYLPIYPVFIFLCLRARSFFFFAASNPKILNGGFLGESKREIYDLVPKKLQPKTIFFSKGSDPSTVLNQLLKTGFEFPLIGKPDIGGRGRGVKKLDDELSLTGYVSACRVDFHIQEFISFEQEAGIFYYRFPQEPRGGISGIVHKEFLKVCGDGQQTVRQLLQENPRAILQLPVLEFTLPEMLGRVPLAGEILTVVPYGNHARGALFLDETVSINPALLNIMDQICQQIPEFYFGRLDIRYESRELLEQGKSFSILEVNGAGSEPTHIYDPRHSLFFAWKEIIRHWFLLYKISVANHRLGHRYLSTGDGIRMYQKDSADSKMLATMTNKTA